uniref:Uncharacterized protein n=1 Tax=Vespula pensylvanica TaxID=30213 RepID=A0A834UB90_VESPE|nr:hypothetical protein H0235_007123 [Vespula pensylvanica]
MELLVSLKLLYWNNIAPLTIVYPAKTKQYSSKVSSTYHGRSNDLLYTIELSAFVVISNVVRSSRNYSEMTIVRMFWKMVREFNEEPGSRSRLLFLLRKEKNP